MKTEIDFFKDKLKGFQKETFDNEFVEGNII